MIKHIVVNNKNHIHRTKPLALAGQSSPAVWIASLRLWISGSQKMQEYTPAPSLKSPPVARHGLRSPGGGGDGRQVTVSTLEGADCKGISMPHNSGQHMCTKCA